MEFDTKMRECKYSYLKIPSGSKGAKHHEGAVSETRPV